jgi:hypothetical protein
VLLSALQRRQRPERGDQHCAALSHLQPCTHAATLCIQAVSLCTRVVSSGIPIMCPGRLVVEAIAVLDFARVTTDVLENSDIVQCTSVVLLLVEHLVCVVGVVSV